MTDSRSSLPNRDPAGRLDGLRQVVREVEGLCKLQDLVPRELMWDRPPGLPSAAELLWMIHLIDEHVFTPLAGSTEPPLEEMPEPDYAGLLAEHPFSADSLEDLAGALRSSRETLIGLLTAAMTSRQSEEGTARLVNMILSHDRRILTAFTERLYESGLGA